jgi:hypothetical protein
MNRADVEADASGGAASTARQALAGRGSAATAASAGRRAVRTGAGPGLGGALLVLRGVRSFRRGARGRGLGQLLVGGLLLALALRQRRSRGDDGAALDATDVATTGPDVEAGATGEAGDSGLSATGDEAAEVVDTSPDVEAAARSGSDASDAADSSEGTDPADSPADEAGSTSVDESDVVDTGVEGDLDDVEPDGSG